MILLQLVVFTPIAMAVFEAVSTGQRRVTPIVRRTVSNPLVVGSVLGMLVSLSGWSPPPMIIEPATLIANACVPVMLISYGISLHGRRVLGTRGRRRDVLVASGLKLFVMPVIAWAVGAFVFRLSPADVLIVTVLAALPTAQNVFNYAQRFDIGEPNARDTVFLTTIGCVPVLLLITVLLGS